MDRLCAGPAEQAADGKRWNTQIVIDPNGHIIGWHHKSFLTKEAAFVQAGTDHNVFEVKGARMGIVTCADGTDANDLKALAARASLRCLTKRSQLNCNSIGSRKLRRQA